MRGMRGAACHLFFVAAALAATSSPHSKSPSWTWGGSAGEPVRPGSVPSGSRGLGSAAHLRLRGGGDDYASMRATFLSGAAGGSPRKPPPSKPAAAAPVASASATWTAPPPTQPPVATPRKNPWSSRPSAPAQRGGAAGGWRGGRGGWGGGKGAGQEKGKGGCKIVLSLSSTSSFVATSSFPPAGVKEACAPRPRMLKDPFYM